MTDERRTNRMAGCCVSLGKCLLIAVAVVLAVLCFLNLNHCFHMTDKGGIYIQVRVIMKDLKIALDMYKLDYNRFPLPSTSATNLDFSFRSRGAMLTSLLGEDTGGLNPKKTKYIYLPQARNHKNGLWQDGAEWVLSDRWGEPYYIVLDTNGDGKISNLEFGAEHQPATLPLKVLIYSSGPDRDPKTWKDNVCSWQPQ